MIARMLRPAGLMLAAAAVAHVLFTGMVSFLAAQTFDVRGPNMRLFNFQAGPNASRIIKSESSMMDHLDLSISYLHERWNGVPQERRVLFLGSSVTWGYPMQSAASLSGAFERASPDTVTANLAVIAGGLTMSSIMACKVRSSGITAATAFLELSIMNDMPAISRNWREPDCVKTNSPGYLGYFSRNAYGIGVLPRIREMHPDRDGNVEVRVGSIPTNYQFDAEYVDGHSQNIRSSIGHAIRSATGIADRVVVFPAPVLIAAFREQSIDTAFLDRYLEIAFEECRQHEAVTCLNTQPTFQDDHSSFFNVTHLNRSGMEKLAELLKVASAQ